MSVTSSGSSTLDNISGSYQSTATEKSNKDDALGRDAFLTMLVAQLQNQDPLNPMDGSDFSAQLAQFSQLEQLMNLNDSMETFAQAFSSGQQGDAMSYLGKQVTGNVNVMTVDGGSVSGGFFNLDVAAEVMVTITDADGNTVKTLYKGQQPAGSNLISWDGTDDNGEAVEDGSYHYTVMANSGYGYSQVPSSLSGTVDGIAYNNGKPYLVVSGILLDPESLTAVSGSAAQESSQSAGSIVEYMGRTVSSGSPIVLVEDGAVSGEALGFHLDTPQEATINIYDIHDELIRTIPIPSDKTNGGQNTVAWDGVADSGYQVPDGLYYYTVKAGSGYARTNISDEVSGIKYINSGQYLVMKDSGRLVALSTLTGIN